MDPGTEKMEQFREFACSGDLDGLKSLVQTQQIDINGKHKMNGWTALHWAAKRNHAHVVSYLLENGADVNIKNNDGEKPADLSTNETIRTTLGGSEDITVKHTILPITPSYLATPAFPYLTPGYQVVTKTYPGAAATYTQSTVKQSNKDKLNPVHAVDHTIVQQALPSYVSDDNEIVLKIRLANSDERDFYEVELEKSKMTYESLLSLMCKELSVERRLVKKIRKLPNTVVRKDKDVKRLYHFQELELVLTNRAVSASSRQYGGENVADGIKSEQILY